MQEYYKAVRSDGYTCIILISIKQLIVMWLLFFIGQHVIL